MSGFVNQLCYGDNLEVLRKMPDEIADLVYLDPPFNSARNYNLLFKQHKGQDSPAQIMAFEDTWQWSTRAYQDFMNDEHNEPLWKLVNSLYDILGESEMMAYIVMMAPRLLELRKKLKSTGSLYLHCDPVASHYLKIILDVIFGPQYFRNEVVWKRSSAHNDTKQGMKRMGKVHDVILFYSKSEDYQWNPVYTKYDAAYLASEYRHVDPATGRRYKEGDLTAAKPGGDTSFLWRVKRRGGGKWEADIEGEWQQPLPGVEYLGVPPYNGRYWAYSHANLVEFWKAGNLMHRSTGAPRLMFFADEMEGVVIQDLWLDIVPPGSKERRGYPTQKPLALLERIIAASSNEGDVVLDPFAGCGTAIVAAERMNRKWIGIDVTYLAINEIIDRLNTEKAEGRELVYTLTGTPKDLDAAEKLFEQTKAQNHKPFEQWAVSLVKGRWNEKKGADRGIDGRLFLRDLTGNLREAVIQVKGGNAMNLSTIRDFANVIESNKSVLGIMIGMKEPTKEMLRVCEQMGYADWPSERRYPRYQILSIEGLLEKGQKPEIPDTYRLGAQTGVGKSQDDGQGGLFG